jgi:hypothetical protein
MARRTGRLPQLGAARESAFALRASARHRAVARQNSPRAEADGSPHRPSSATGCGSGVRLRPAGFGETSRRSAPELTARGGGWLAALDVFRNWVIQEAA